MKVDSQDRRPGEPHITGLSALGAVVVLSVAGLVGCKSAPTRVAAFHDPFLPTMVAETAPASETATAELASTQQTAPLAKAEADAKQDCQFQLTGY